MIRVKGGKVLSCLWTKTLSKTSHGQVSMWQKSGQPSFLYSRLFWIKWQENMVSKIFIKQFWLDKMKEIRKLINLLFFFLQPWENWMLYCTVIFAYNAHSGNRWKINEWKRSCGWSCAKLTLKFSLDATKMIHRCNLDATAMQLRWT